METILNQKLVKYLENHQITHDRQYGFRPKRSVSDLLTFLSHKLNSVLHKSGEACLVALDISKAFDRVWHDALLAKCHAIGLGNFFCKWIKNFLSNRSIKVFVDGFASDLYHINSGVAQGSVLSATLFIIFINDLLSITSNPIYSYADDSSLVASYEFSKKSLSTLQSVTSSRTLMINSLMKNSKKLKTGD